MASLQDRYLHMVFGASPNIIMALDEKGCFVYCADAFLRRARIKSFEDIRRRSFQEVFSRFASTELLDTLQSAFGLPPTMELGITSSACL